MSPDNLEQPSGDGFAPPSEHPPTLGGSRTHDHLKAAFALDSQTTELYLYFSKIAEIEGNPGAAQLFRDLADSERLFAAGHLDFLMRVGDPLTSLPVGETQSNLGVAVAGGSQDVEEGLPDMARTANSEGFPDIASWFNTLANAKRAHVQHLGRILSQARENSG